jgi:DNA-binding transcriptional LysR family regulator
MHHPYDVGTPSRLAAVDLNLLTIFRAVDDTRHVTRAASVLGISQPALSHALKRLRDVFDDALFVKTPRGMVPTPLAEALASPIRRALEGIERDVLARGPFDPHELARTFVVRATDLVETLLAPPLLARLAEEAPRVRFAIVPTSVTLPKTELEGGSCDLAIAGFFGELPDGFRQERVFEDAFECAVREGHPRIRAGSRPSLDAFCRERHLLVAPGGDLTGQVDRALAKKRKTRQVSAGASGFLMAGWMAAESDCVVTAPSRVLERLAQRLPLSLFTPPVALDRIRVVSVWHARSDADPAHAWFRGMVKTLLSS